MDLVSTTPVLHAAVTAFLAGLIWVIQVVHYPLFLRVGAAVPAEEWRAYEAAHCRRIAWVVLPAMLLEAGLAVLLWLQAEPGRGTLATIGVALLAAVWASTFLLQVPCHRRLEVAWDPAAARRLVATNWIRTLAWSGRVPVALAMLPT